MGLLVISLWGGAPVDSISVSGLLDVWVLFLWVWFLLFGLFVLFWVRLLCVIAWGGVYCDCWCGLMGMLFISCVFVIIAVFG